MHERVGNALNLVIDQVDSLVTEKIRRDAVERDGSQNDGEEDYEEKSIPQASNLDCESF